MKYAHKHFIFLRRVPRQLTNKTLDSRRAWRFFLKIANAYP